MTTVTLYHIEPSFYSQIVRLALFEKGVSWQPRSINIGPLLENYEPWYMRINPKGVVPTLDHDGKIVTDAFRIIRYIDQHFDGPPLHPEDPQEQEKMEAWLQKLDAFPEREFSYSTRGKGLAGQFLRKLMNFSYHRRRQVLKKHKAKNPDLADLYDFRLRDLDIWQTTSNDPEKAAQLLAQQEQLLDELEKDLEDRTWLTGDHYTLVDLAWTVFLARLEVFGKSTLWQGGKRPLVEAYYQRLKQRPSFQKADIWVRMRPSFMVRLIAPFALPRLLLALTILTALGFGLWRLFLHFKIFG